MASQQDLLTLPLDVLIHLTTMADPLDVIQLGRACKRLYDIYSERSVWLGIMRKIRNERQLFFPDFLLQQHSTRELMDAATSPGRWSTLSSSPRNQMTPGQLQPVRERVYSLLNHPERLQERPDLIGDILMYNLETYLVPGGQYLLSWSGCWLALWQIGKVCTHPSPLVAVVYVKDYRAPDERTRTRNYGMTVQALAGGNGLRVLVFDYHGETIWRCIVFDIEVGVDTPCFNQVAVFDGPAHDAMNGYVLSGDILVAVFQSGEICVWNFIQNAWAKWRYDIDVNVTCALIDASHLLLIENWPSDHDLDRRKSFVFRIPELVKLPRGKSLAGNLPAAYLAPATQNLIALPHCSGYVLDRIASLSTWRANSPGGRIFLTRRIVHSDAITFLQILDVCLDASDAVTLTPSQIPSIGADLHRMRICFSGESLTDFLGVQTLYHDRTDIITSYSQPASHRLVGFSPASGRLSFTLEHQAHEIHVLDLI